MHTVAVMLLAACIDHDLLQWMITSALTSAAGMAQLFGLLQL